MPALSQEKPSSSWQELLLDTLRLAARVAIKLNQASLPEMKKLIGVALYRELRGRGETLEAMSLTLDCSLRTVKNLSKHSREVNEQPSGDGVLRRVIKRLERGPATRDELNRLLPISMEFDVAKVAYGVLQAESLIEPHTINRQKGLALTETWNNREAVDWESPLGEIERLRRLGLSVFARLNAEAQSLNEIADTPRLRKLPKHKLLRVLDFMTAEGIVEEVNPTAKGSKRIWRLTQEVQRMKSSDPRARWRQGLMYLMERLGLFVDFALSGQREDVVSQHSISFDARAEDLKPFYRCLHKWVIQSLIELDSKADRLGGGSPCQIVWFASPLLE